MKEAPRHAEAWSGMIQGLSDTDLIDDKTAALAYLSVLAALRLESGIPFHVRVARELGCSRAEVIGAILVGLPAAGISVTQALPAAIEAYDTE
jgi:alkylhydroperoxidase/carboxymuconolactone decarboxylase family protein YurZ